MCFISLFSSTQWSDLLLQRCPLLIFLFYFQFHFWHFVVFSFVPCVFFFIFSYTLDRIFTKNNFLWFLLSSTSLPYFINCVLSTVYYFHFFVSLYFQIFSSLVFFTITFALFSRFLVVKVFFILFYKLPTILQYQ